MSTVDYIVTNAISAPLVHSCSTLNHDPLNTSDHFPLSITLACETQSERRIDSPPAHLNWKRALCDRSIDLFVARINNLLRSLIGKNYTSPLELNEEVKLVSESIICIASSSNPGNPRNVSFMIPSSIILVLNVKQHGESGVKLVDQNKGPVFDEKNNLKRLTKNCANKCRARRKRSA